VEGSQAKKTPIDSRAKPKRCKDVNVGVCKSSRGPKKTGCRAVLCARCNLTRWDKKKASNDELTEEYVEVREEETATTSPRRTSLRNRDKKGEKADKTGVAHKKNQNGCEHTKRECFQTETSGVYFDETWREQETAKGKGGDLLDINCMDCGRDVRLEPVDDDCEAE
jgi:hypothetical protein